MVELPATLLAAFSASFKGTSSSGFAISSLFFAPAITIHSITAIDVNLVPLPRSDILKVVISDQFAAPRTPH